MVVIIDANLLVALVSGDPRGSLVERQFLTWFEQGINLHAPTLAQYEVANALTRLIVAKAFPLDRLEDALTNLSLLPITYHPLNNGLRTIEIALMLKRQSAYDASYLALAEEMRAELYTLDGPLYRNAIEKGFSIHLLE